MARKSAHRKLSRKARNDQSQRWDVMGGYRPFVKTPDELIVIILEQLGKMSRYFLKNALYVCRKWHDIGMPILWTAMRFDKLCEIGTLGVCLGRHRGPRLTSRIRSLTFNMSEDSLTLFGRQSQQGPTKQAVSAIGRLEHLESFSVRAPYSHIHIVSSLVQSLRLSVMSLEVHLDNDKKMHASCEHAGGSVCSAVRSKLKHLTHVNLRGTSFCRQLVPHDKDAMGSGEMTICLIDSRYRQFTDHLAFNLASLFAAHYRTPQAVDTVKRVTTINFQANRPIPGSTHQTYFDIVHIRNVAEGQQTIIPARVLNTYERSAAKHLFLRLTSKTKGILHNYYATSWNQVVFLADPTAWLEEQDLGIRLPKTLRTSPIYRYRGYRWRALAATPSEVMRKELIFPKGHTWREVTNTVLAYEDAADVPTSSMHISNMQQMHDELFQYERAAGRPLLLPMTKEGIRVLNGCCRERAPQELNGTFTSEHDNNANIESF